MNGQNAIMLIDNKISEDHLICIFIILRNVQMYKKMVVGTPVLTI